MILKEKNCFMTQSTLRQIFAKCSKFVNINLALKNFYLFNFIYNLLDKLVSSKTFTRISKYNF